MSRAGYAARIMWRSLSALLLLVVASCGQPDSAPAGIDYARLDLARHGHRVERLGNTVYAFGGFTRAADAPERGTRQVFAFDLPRGPWAERRAMAGGHAFFGSGVVGGRIFAIGSTVERYDATENRWSTLPTATRLPKSHFATATWRGRLHVLGGYPMEAAGHQAIDPATGRVEALEPPPNFVPSDHFHILVVLNGHLHAIGGLRDGGSKLSGAHHAFDGKAWTQRAPPPMALWTKFAAQAVVADTLYVFSPEGDVAYDARVDSWRRVKPMPIHLVMPATLLIDGRIVVMGGRPLKEEPRSVQVYDPAADAWAVHRPSVR